MKLWYLASPYSRFKGGHDAAAEAVAEQAALLLDAGVDVFSPIVHSHAISKHTEASSQDHRFWLDRDLVYMEVCHGMIECRLSGWEKSYGMAWERKWFEEHGKPIIVMNPWLVPRGLRRVA